MLFVASMKNTLLRRIILQCYRIKKQYMYDIVVL